jgi:hypothetical protein
VIQDGTLSAYMALERSEVEHCVCVLFERVRGDLTIQSHNRHPVGLGTELEVSRRALR